jgi:hypothetical protein
MKPLQQCYQLPLLPGITFGEYPGDFVRTRALEQVRAFSAAGISCFIDITDERDGLFPYMPLFPEVLPEGVGPPLHLRFPLRDQSIPDEPRDMRAILDALDEAVASGHNLYVHCWGGIGRTGMVAGCYLVRHGLTGELALQELTRLFSRTPLGQAGRHSPETYPQRRFILEWAQHDQKATWPPASDAEFVAEQNRFRGCLLGAALAEARAGPRRSPGSRVLEGVAATIMPLHRSPSEAVAKALEVAKAGRASPPMADASRIVAALLLGALRGVPRDVLLGPHYLDRLGFWYGEILHPDALALVTPTLSALRHAPDFESGFALIRKAKGNRVVFGQLAGALTGADGVPADQLPNRAAIIEEADRRYRGATGLDPIGQVQAERYARRLIADAKGDLVVAAKAAKERTTAASPGGPPWAGKVWGRVVEILTTD